MGKKKQSDMDVVKKKFLKQCKRKDAEEIFEMIEVFAGYGFNKSHSISYAYITHQTAFLKANYPIQFYCATMQVNVSNPDKLMRLIDEARKFFNIDFNPIDHFDTLNCNRFRVVENKISLAVQVIKHFSETAAIKLSLIHI